MLCPINVFRFETDRTSPDYEDDEEWMDEENISKESEYTILSRKIALEST